MSEDPNNKREIPDPTNQDIIVEAMEELGGMATDPAVASGANTFRILNGGTPSEDDILGRGLKAQYDAYKNASPSGIQSKSDPQYASQLDELMDIADEFTADDGTPTVLAKRYMRLHIADIERNKPDVDKDAIVCNDVHDSIKERYGIDPDSTPMSKAQVQVKVLKEGSTEPDTVVVDVATLKRMQRNDQIIKLYRKVNEKLKTALNHEPTLNEVVFEIIKMQSPTKEIFLKYVEKYQNKMEAQGFKYDEDGHPIITPEIQAEHDALFGDIDFGNDPEISLDTTDGLQQQDYDDF